MEHFPMETGKTWRTETCEVLFDRGRMFLSTREEVPMKPMKIPETGTYVYDESLKFRLKEVAIDDSFSIPIDKTTISLESSKIQFPLLLRPCRPGDRFVPFGMYGSKLVSDYLTDRKKTLFEKRRQLVLTNSNGDILWLVGERPDNRYRITAKTTTALTISMIRTDGM
jgi:tRNA(Ile)-lysidine synthase